MTFGHNDQSLLALTPLHEEARSTHCIAKKTYSNAKAKIQEKILGQTNFLKNRMQKDNFYKSFRLRSNKSTLLIQHDVICATDNTFLMVKLSKSIHEHGNKIA